jgi:hypothetical protein
MSIKCSDNLAVSSNSQVTLIQIFHEVNAQKSFDVVFLDRLSKAKIVRLCYWVIMLKFSFLI